jgi:hypothetical protein
MQEQSYNTQFNVETQNKKEKQKNKMSTMKEYIKIYLGNGENIKEYIKTHLGNGENIKEYIKTYLGNGENIVETFWHKRHTIVQHHTK